MKYIDLEFEKKKEKKRLKLYDWLRESIKINVCSTFRQ